MRPQIYFSYQLIDDLGPHLKKPYVMLYFLVFYYSLLLKTFSLCVCFQEEPMFYSFLYFRDVVHVQPSPLIFWLKLSNNLSSIFIKNLFCSSLRLCQNFLRFLVCNIQSSRVFFLVCHIEIDYLGVSRDHSSNLCHHSIHCLSET